MTTRLKVPPKALIPLPLPTGAAPRAVLASDGWTWVSPFPSHALRGRSPPGKAVMRPERDKTEARSVPESLRAAADPAGQHECVAADRYGHAYVYSGPVRALLSIT